MNTKTTTSRFGRAGMTVMLLLAAAVAASSTAYAFGGPGGEGRDERRIERMAQHLSLTDAQKQKVEKIMQENREQGQSLHQAMRGLRDKMHQLDPSAANYGSEVAKLADQKAELARQMVIHRSEVRAEMHAVLTPEQREKASQMRKSFKGERHGKQGFGKGRCDR